MAFKKAIREKVKAKIAITGASGAGKSLSALLFARGLAGPKGRIAVIDTENRSALYYAGSKEFPEVGEFDHDGIAPPYTPEKYVDAINSAVRGGYDVVIVDSLSHIWIGQGGILEKVDAAQSRGGNKFAAWGPGTKSWNDVVNAVLYSPIHLIATMRSKMAYAEDKDESGKTKIRKMGLAPQVRDGAEYEFGIVLDIEKETHTAAVSALGKDRSSLFDGKFFKITPEHGAALARWLDAASADAPPAPAPSVDDCDLEYEERAPQARPPANGNGNGGQHAPAPSRMEQVVGDRLPDFQAPAAAPAPAPQGDRRPAHGPPPTTPGAPYADQHPQPPPATLGDAKTAALKAGYRIPPQVAAKLAEFTGRPEATTWESLHPAEFAAVAEGFRRISAAAARPAQPQGAGAA